MKSLSKISQRIFDKLIAGLHADGNARKIDTSSFMPIHVDRVHTTAAGTVYAVAHYFRQNGDSMADPDMTFLLASTDGRAYPITFRQDGGCPVNHNAVVWSDHGTITAVRPRMQREITTFANQWMKNIRAQQRAL